MTPRMFLKMRRERRHFLSDGSDDEFTVIKNKTIIELEKLKVKKLLPYCYQTILY